MACRIHVIPTRERMRERFCTKRYTRQTTVIHSADNVYLDTGAPEQAYHIGGILGFKLVSGVFVN